MKYDDLIRMELSRINSHLPRSRLSLKELLEMEEPRVTLRDGSFHFFRRRELELLSGLVEKWDLLKLPIVLEISGPRFRVRGRAEVEAIDKVLGIYDPLDEHSERLYQRYLLSKIRRILPTTTTVAFMV